MITYNDSLKEIQVRLYGKVIGRIIKINGGFAFHPKGTPIKFHGQVFPTCDEVKKHIELE